MPKGIYPRGNRNQATPTITTPVSAASRPSQNFDNLSPGGMKTQFVEAPVTTETANANVVKTVSQSGDDSEMSTTERLFGDLINDPENAIEPQEIGVPVPVHQSPDDKISPVPAIPVIPVLQQTQVPPIPPIDNDSFDIEKVLNKKVKAKIDGKEEEVTLKELRDSYQINKHLAQAADKVGEERRKLAEERRQIQELRQQRQQQYQEPVNGQYSGQYSGTPSYMQPSNSPQQFPQVSQVSQELNPLYAKINSLEQQLSQFVEGTRPAVFESNRQRVANELKSQGFDDFLNYVPKMESHLLTLQDPTLVNFYDTPTGAKALYFQLKAQDMNQVRMPMPQNPAPISHVTPPATRVDSGSQPNGSMNDDGASNYKRAFKRAVEMGTDSLQARDAWNQVLIHKGIIPGE